MKRRTAVGISFALAAIVLFVYFYARSFLAQDKCLDNGGRWNGESSTCEYVTP